MDRADFGTGKVGLGRRDDEDTRKHIVCTKQDEEEAGGGGRERKARRTDSECTRCKEKRHGSSYRNFNWELARRYDTMYLRIRGGRRLPFSFRFSLALAVRGDKGTSVRSLRSLGVD